MQVLNLPKDPTSQSPQRPNIHKFQVLVPWKKTWMPAFVVMLSLDKCSKNLLSSDRFIQGNFFCSALESDGNLEVKVSCFSFNWRLQAESFQINPNLHNMKAPQIRVCAVVRRILSRGRDNVTMWHASNIFWISTYDYKGPSIQDGPHGW